MHVDRLYNVVYRHERINKSFFSRPIAHTEPLFKTFNLLEFNDMYTLKLKKFLCKFSNDSLTAYFALYKTLIQLLTTRYPLRRMKHSK